ncbi:MAG: helix-turn-helix domain-containing protein [Clostridia bacterium]|nr:helix-turn-helix domain-containing protein [Clostridia bacterium]
MTEIIQPDDLNEWTDWIDSQDVMQKLHVSVRTLQSWRTNGLLPYSRINNKIYYRKSDILSLLNKFYIARREADDDESTQ